MSTLDLVQLALLAITYYSMLSLPLWLSDSPIETEGDIDAIEK